MFLTSTSTTEYLTTCTFPSSSIQVQCIRVLGYLIQLNENGCACTSHPSIAFTIFCIHTNHEAEKLEDQHFPFAYNPMNLKNTNMKRLVSSKRDHLRYEVVALPKTLDI